MNFATHAWLPLVLILAGAGKLRSEGALSALAPGDATSDIAVQSSGPSPRKIESFGETFVLLRSSRSESVDTEEYSLNGEPPGNWSQLLTYQRFSLSSPLAADQYVRDLKSTLARDASGPRFRLLEQHTGASIFALQYNGSQAGSPQVVLALAIVPEAERPNQLHLIQFALNPDRVPLPQMELLMKRWQAQFSAQAALVSDQKQPP